MCKQNLTPPAKFHFFPNSSSLSNEPVILILLAESSRKTWSSPLFWLWCQGLSRFFGVRGRRGSFLSLCYFNFPNLLYPTTPNDWLQSLHTNPNCIPLLVKFLKKNYSHRNYEWLPTSCYENYSHRSYEWLPISCYERVQHLLSFQGPLVMSSSYSLHPTVLPNIKSLIQTKMS